VVGKQIRMERIMNRDTGRTVIVPMDHGVTVGPIEGLIDMKTTVNAVASGGANAILIHKGLVSSGHRRRGKDVGLIIHLSGSTALSPFPNAKTLVCTVEEAIKLGADGVSIHVNSATADGPTWAGSREAGNGDAALRHVAPGGKDQRRIRPGVIMHVARWGGAGRGHR
jgi:class I fructose-bisphosphate aldolase